MRNHGMHWLALLASMALISFGAGAADYYAAPDGSDSNPGTIEAPLRTLAVAIPALAPGDTLYIRGGTYAEAINSYDIAIPEGESWDNPVRIAAYPGETVTIRPDAGSDVVRPMGTRYVIFEGLVLDASNVENTVVKITWGSSYYGAHHIRFVACELMNSPGQGALVNNEGAGDGYNEFIDCSVHDNGATDFDHGLYITNDYNLVDGCRIYRNSGWGVHIYNGTDGETADNNVVRNNLIYDNARVGNRGVGIGIYTGAGGMAYNNVMWNNKIGISLNYGVSGVKVYNNTIHGSVEYGISVGDGCSGADLRNNIAWLSGWGDFEDAGAGTSQGINLFGADPLFADAGGADFHLLAASPAVDTGEAIADVPSDRDGIPRPQGAAFDIGAYEYFTGEPGEAESVPDGPSEDHHDEAGEPPAADGPDDTGTPEGDGEAPGAGQGCGCAIA